MDFEDFVDFVDILEENNRPIIRKRYIRDVENPFELYSMEEFKKRYRFSKETVLDILLPLIYEELNTNNNRGLPITPVYQLFLALRFYATGEFQTIGGDLRGVSQPTVSRTIKRVSQVLAGHLRTYVKFPDPQVIQENMRKFFEVAHFPGITSCIDGTHIPIKNPGGNVGEVFRNRKGIFSLNVQVACGPSMDILDIVVRFPGSMHDNVIFQRSSLRVKYENNEIPGKILGDNGYACQRYLLTPVINPETRAENNYNSAHKRTRNIIERLFGIWKRRFPCLRRVLETELDTSVAIICAVAMLHNLARAERDNIRDYELDDNAHQGHVDNIIDNPNADAILYRRAFILSHFNN